MNEDKIISLLLSHDERLQKIEDKVYRLDDLDRLIQGQDKMMKILLRLVQERIFTNEKVNRIEKRVEKIENIDFIKPKLQPN